MIKKSASKWLSLATITILGQPPRQLLLFGLMLFTIHSHSATPKEIVATAQDQNKLAITIYQQNLAFIKDTRHIHLAHDANLLAWHEVSAQMQPETALLRNVTNPIDFHLQEQNFDYDLLTPQKLLEKHTSKPISVIRTNPSTGEEIREAATVLTTNGGVILQFTDRIETGIPGRLAFPEVPSNLRNKPTFIASFTSATAGKQELELSYLTAGLSWQADYIVELNENKSHINLNGLATLTNNSGIAYKNANLQLIAGDLHHVSSPQAYAPAKLRSMAAEVASNASMQSDALFEYHRYTLPRPTTLENNQKKQVAFFTAKQIPVHETFLLQGQNYYYSGRHNHLNQAQMIDVFINFQNAGKGLGIPLPRGIMRTYINDSQDDLQFIGEDRINHTPYNADIRLKLGHAFDITAERTQTDFKKLPAATQHERHFETAHQITVKNAKKEAVTLDIQEPIPGDWTILSESLPHEKETSNLAKWQVTLPTESEVTLTYRVRVKL